MMQHTRRRSFSGRSGLWLTVIIYICRVLPMKLRLSPQTLMVLEVFLEEPREWRYGYDISRITGLKSGSLYPILIRLAERELLETEWEVNEAGKPPRHLYRLTPDGLQLARERQAARAPVRQRRSALSGAES